MYWAFLCMFDNHLDAQENIHPYLSHSRQLKYKCNTYPNLTLMDHFHYRALQTML